MSSLLVVFPGIRYSCDRSMLYFSEMIIKEQGYEVKELHYEMPRDSQEEIDLDKSISNALLYSEEHLQDIDFSKYERVIFLSKSIGTVVAGELKKKLNLDNVSQIFITPLTETVPYFEKDDLIITSNNDRFFPDAAEKVAPFNNSYVFPNCPHSFEFKGNYQLTMKILTDVLGVISRYVQTIDQKFD